MPENKKKLRDFVEETFCYTVLRVRKIIEGIKNNFYTLAYGSG